MEAVQRKLGVAALLIAAALGGCNTIEGAGQDIQKGGEAIEDAADDAED